MAATDNRDSNGSWEENSILSEGFSAYSSSSGSSSSSNISDDEEVETVRGAEPYRFEPLAANTGAEGEGRDVPVPEQPANDRLLNIDWCSCVKCVPMEDIVNCYCCKESPEIQAKVDETREFVEFEDEGRCFTDHPYYPGTCLNPGTLQTVYYLYRQHYGRRAVEGTREQKYRHMSYRQIVRWCWGFLGKYNRVPLPSCIMNMARTTYPNPQGEYVGFKYPPIDE